MGHHSPSILLIFPCAFCPLMPVVSGLYSRVSYRCSCRTVSHSAICRLSHKRFVSTLLLNDTRQGSTLESCHACTTSMCHLSRCQYICLLKHHYFTGSPREMASLLAGAARDQLSVTQRGLPNYQQPGNLDNLVAFSRGRISKLLKLFTFGTGASRM